MTKEYRGPDYYPMPGNGARVSTDVFELPPEPTDPILVAKREELKRALFEVAFQDVHK